MVKTNYEFRFVAPVKQPIGELYLLTRSNTPYKGGSIDQSNETFGNTVFECHVTRLKSNGALTDFRRLCIIKYNYIFYTGCLACKL